MAKPKQTKQLKFRYRLALMSILAALLLVVANSAIWINRNIFDSQTFTRTATASITSESSRQAMASEIVDRALADRPVLRNVAGATATKLVAGLLGTDQFEQVLQTAVSKVQIYLTSKEQKTIALDLTGIKSTVNNLLTLADNRGLADTSSASQRADAVPDQIVVVNASDIPSFYTYGLIFLWLGPVFGLLALVLLVLPYWQRPRRYYQIAVVQGVALATAGVLSFLIGPLFRPPALARVVSPNMRVVVGNLYDAFIVSFNKQAGILVAIGLALAVIPSLVFLASKYLARKK